MHEVEEDKLHTMLGRHEQILQEGLHPTEDKLQAIKYGPNPNTFTCHWPHEGQLSFHLAMCIDLDGKIYVGNCGNNCIQVFHHNEYIT